MAASAGGSEIRGESVAIAVAIIVIVFWMIAHKGIAGAILSYAQLATWGRAQIPFFDQSYWAAVYQKIVPLRASQMTFGEDIFLLGLAGKAWWFAFAGLSGFVGYGIYNSSVRNRYKRRMNLKQFILEQSKTFTAILPSARSNLSFESKESGPWRRADLPYEFALRNHLLVHEDPKYDFQKPLQFMKTGENRPEKIKNPPKLRINATRARYARFLQESPLLISKYQQMKPEYLALIAAFSSWIAGDYLNDEYSTRGGNPLIASYNESFEPFIIHYPKGIAGEICKQVINFWLPGEQKYHNQKKLKSIVKFFGGKIEDRVKVDYKKGIDFLKRGHVAYISRKEGKLQGDKSLEEKSFEIFLSHAKNHAFVLPLLCGLLESARALQILPTASFLWLKPVNIHAFYVLNSLGRPGAWAEAAGDIAHYRVEKKERKAIHVPQVDGAVYALRQELLDYGWISEEKV